MKSKIVLIMIFLLFFSNLFADTFIPDGSEVYGNWTLPNSPYIIGGVAIIPNGETLSIEPGVIIKFYVGYTFNCAYLVIDGKLIANGSDESPITFTRYSSGNWGILYFSENADSSNVLRYCIIEYGNSVNGTYREVIYHIKGIIENCKIKYNNCGAISTLDSNTSIINNCIHNNGGAIQCENSSPLITNNIIDNNCFGIGLDNSNPIISKNVISNHFMAANLSYGVYCLNNSNPNLLNNTFVANFHAIQSSNSFPIILNSILYNNTFAFNIFSGNPIVAYSLIQGTNLPDEIINAGGNIQNMDPMFTDPINGDYSLLENSPCIDTGTAFFEWAGNIIIDLEEDEYFGLAPDMGCYEWQDVNSNEYEIKKAVAYINNFPNPFNPSTTISFFILEESKVELSIFNLKGQKVRTFAHSDFIKGNHSVIWNGNDESGKSVSSGLYLYKININGKTEAVKKCLLLK